MEEPLQHDKFEDFLKKSFEKYRESPSDGLWDKIDGDLGAVTPAAKGFSAMHWLIGSALVTLLGIIGYQQLALKSTAEELKKELIIKENEVKVTRSAVEKREIAYKALEEKVQQLEKSVAAIEVPPTSGIEKHPAALSKSQKISVHQHRTAEKSSLTGSPLQTSSVQSSPIVEVPTTAPLLINNILPDVQTKVDLVAAETKAGVGMTSLPALPQRLQPLSLDVDRLPVMPLFQDIEKIRYPGKWSLGAEYISMKTASKVTDYEPVPDNPFPNGYQVRSFVDTATAKGNTVMAGVSLKCQLTPQFSIASGLNYRNKTMYSTHQPPLRFSDGHHHEHGGGPGDPDEHEGDYDFTYQLNTSYGTYDIDLRAQQIDSSAEIEEDEPVGLSIETKNVQESLTIPLMLAYRLNKNRFHVDIKGGLLTNLLLSNRINIEDITFNDAHFKAPESMDHYGVPKDELCFSMDYIAGIGLGYDITDAMTLNVTPVVSGSLFNRNYGTVKTSDFSTGISTGISYRF